MSARPGGVTPAAAARAAFRRYMLARLRRRTRGWRVMPSDRPVVPLSGSSADFAPRTTGPCIVPPPLERGPMRRARQEAARA